MPFDQPSTLVHHPARRRHDDSRRAATGQNRRQTDNRYVDRFDDYEEMLIERSAQLVTTQIARRAG